MNIGERSRSVDRAYGSTPFVFKFIDDPTWRNAISEFSYTHSAYGSNVYKLTNSISVTSGQIVVSGHIFREPGTWVITVKATGYPDTVLTVVSY